MTRDTEDMEKWMVSAELREALEGYKPQKIHAYRHAGSVGDETIIRLLNHIKAHYDPIVAAAQYEDELRDRWRGRYPDRPNPSLAELAGEFMPSEAETARLFRMLWYQDGTMTLTRAIHQGDTQTQSAAVGDPASRSDISGLKAIQELIDVLAIPAPIIYIYGEPGSGKTNFALLLAQLWKREMGDEAVLASNIRTWREADEWLPSYGALKQRIDEQTEEIEGGGITAREDAPPFLFLFDEASSHASGRGEDGYEAGQKLGPLVYKIRKARAGLIIIGHDGKDVHPAVRTQALVIRRFRGEVKRAEVFEDVSNREGVGHIMSLNGIPETDYRYDDEEATSWDWRGAPVDDELEEATLEQARDMADEMHEEQLRELAWRLDKAEYLEIDQDAIGAVLDRSQQWVSKWSNRLEREHTDSESDDSDDEGDGALPAVADD